MSAVDLRQLALMVALHETQSLSAAASRVHMTPSAASQSLQRLRAHLDEELVSRQGNAYVATAFGDAALDAFRDILRTWDEVSSGSPVFDPPSSRAHWTILFAEEFTEFDVDTCYAAIVSAAPDVTLDVGTQEMATLGWSALRNGRADVLLTTHAPPTDAGDLHAERFPDAVFSRVCLSVAHPRIRGELDPDTLTRESQVALAGSDGVDEGRRGGLSTVSSLARLASVVATTDRVALVTAHQGAVLLRMVDGLRTLPLPSTMAFAPVPRYMVWHHRSHHAASARWLRERVRSHVFTGTMGPPMATSVGR